MSGRNPRILAEVAAMHARRREWDAAGRILAELRERAATGYIELSLLGSVHAALGHMDDARALVSRGIEEHEPWWQFSASPAWAAFRADAEGAAMLRRQGFA